MAMHEPHIMTAVCVRQPWTGLLACEFKLLEQRSWRPGRIKDSNAPLPLLIVASKASDPYGWQKHGDWIPDNPRLADACSVRGAALGVADVWPARKMMPDEEYKTLCDYIPGIYVWPFTNSKLIPAGLRFPVKGRLGLFEVALPDPIWQWLEADWKHLPF